MRRLSHMFRFLFDVNPCPFCLGQVAKEPGGSGTREFANRDVHLSFLPHTLRESQQYTRQASVSTLEKGVQSAEQKHDGEVVPRPRVLGTKRVIPDDGQSLHLNNRCSAGQIQL